MMQSQPTEIWQALPREPQLTADRPKSAVAAGRPRRLQFSLRFLLIAITIFSVWLGVRVNQARRQREAIAHLTVLNARVVYAHQSADGRYDRPWNPKAQPAAPAWLREWLGDDYFVSPTGVTVVNLAPTDADLAALAALPTLRCVTVAGGSGSSTRLDWSQLTSLRKLEMLRLYGPPIDDEGVAQLRTLTNLKTLVLGSTKITDRSLTHVTRLSRLENLELPHTAVTDTGLKALYDLPRLKRLNVLDTRVTDGGIAELEGVLPDCKVER